MTHFEATHIYVGLGSNLDNPIQQLHSALADLQAHAQITITQVSPFYRNPPVGFESEHYFVNAVAQLETALSPDTLLTTLLQVEEQHGRTRGSNGYSSRTLDLDLLLYGNLQTNSERLILPHPRLAQRAFVLVPLSDIAPDLVLPNGEKLSSLAASCDKSGLASI